MILKEKLAERNRELALMSIQLNHQKNLINDIRNYLKEIDSKDSRIILRRINESQFSSNQWDQFKIHFERIHPKFFGILETAHPELSDHNLRICAYIKMYMENKAIARLLQITPKGLETAKYRLKENRTVPNPRTQYLYTHLNKID